MTGLWLASYLLLWVAAVCMGVVTVAMLRQFGLLRAELGLSGVGRASASGVPDIEDDGPAIGSRLPELTVDPISGGPLVLSPGRRTLLVFMSATCPGCQRAVHSVNALAGDEGRSIDPVVILRAEEATCRAFLDIFPLDTPVICDDRRITMGLGIHRNPFALLYDGSGRLVGKGIVEGRDDLEALLGDMLPRTLEATAGLGV